MGGLVVGWIVGECCSWIHFCADDNRSVGLLAFGALVILTPNMHQLVCLILIPNMYQLVCYFPSLNMNQLL